MHFIHLPPYASGSQTESHAPPPRQTMKASQVTHGLLTKTAARKNGQDCSPNGEPWPMAQ